jgi:uncharacterized membrane protein YcaP (DUF421 family)
MEMYINIATKILVGSIGIFTLLRLMGKKAMSELTPFDILYIVVLGALVEEAIYDDQVKIFHVLFAILLWGVTVFIIENLLEKTERLSTLIQGEPSVLIDRGKLNMKELKDNHFDMEQLRFFLRQNGCYSINDAYYVVLEVGGGLTVITKENMEIPTFLLIEEGAIKPKTLESLGKTEEWLQEELKKLGFENMDSILYCEWDANKEELIYDTYENTINEKVYLDD